MLSELEPMPLTPETIGLRKQSHSIIPQNLYPQHKIKVNLENLRENSDD